MSGLGLILAFAALWLGISWMRGRRHCGGSGIGWKVLGVAAIVGGVALFYTRHDHFQSEHIDADPSDRFERIELDDHALAERIDRVVESRGFMHRGVGILLGTVLIIAGAMLFGRERTRPGAIRAFTVLAVAATVFALVSFFSNAPHGSAARERIVQVIHSDRAAATDAPASTKKPGRSQRAKRPSNRPQRPATATGAAEELPPRAGEIPVAAELGAPETSTTGSAAPSIEPAIPPVAAVAPTTEPPVPAASSSPPATPPAAPTAVPEADHASAPIAPAKPPAQAAETVQIAVTERPAWVDAPARLVDSVYRVSIKSGLFVSVPECQRELDQQIQRETDHYLDEYLGEQASTLVDIPLDYLKKHIKKAEYAETVASESVGPMHQIHALLEFDDEARADFHHLWHNAMVTNRLWYAASGAALVLALLGTLYGYLKMDLRTGGAHQGSLQLAATLVALIVAAGVLLVRWTVPF